MTEAYRVKSNARLYWNIANNLKILLVFVIHQWEEFESSWSVEKKLIHLRCVVFFPVLLQLSLQVQTIFVSKWARLQTKPIVIFEFVSFLYNLISHLEVGSNDNA